MILKKLFITFFSKITKILLVIILALPINGFSQSVIYVKHDAGGGNDGTSWTDAYTSLQSALENAIKDDSIWVAAGTYYPTVDKNGDPPLPAYLRTKTFQLVDSVSLYGGFDGTETNIEERDWKTNETILSGDIGTIDDKSDNSYNVTIGADSIVLDGFTITHGNANGPAIPNETNMGGGINNNNVSYVRILNCTFKDNDSDQGGGAGNYYCGDSIIFKNCVFWADTADSGGGIGNWNTQVNISQCTFIYNAATDPSIGFGGAIYNWGAGSTSEIINCTFYKNSAYQGGGIHNRGVASSCMNSILWQNNGDAIINTNPGGGCSVSYCAIDQDAYSSGTGCFDTDPKIYINSEDECELNGASPCIDAGNPDPAYNDPDDTRNDMGAYHAIFSPQVDALISAIDTPLQSFIYGDYDVWVTMVNLGTDPLTSAGIDWTVDGTSQTTYNWTGNLPASDTTESFKIGNYIFNEENDTIKAWTSIASDEFHGNDTLLKEIYVFSHMDAGIVSLDDPDTLCSFEISTDLYVSFKNYDTDSTLTNVDIDWEVDGTPQTLYNWTGILLPGETSGSFTIGPFSFSRGKHDLTIWTDNPGSHLDDNKNNDTLKTTIYSRAYDIGVSALYTPTDPDTIGLHPVNVSIKNYSADSTITSATIQWEVEGAPQTQFDWTGSLLPGETSDSIEIGTYNVASTGTLLFKIWTKAPNGDTDDYHENDTLLKEINIADLLHGTFTIGATGDFPTFEKAVDSLVNGGGICEPVVFNIETGIYNEQITIPEIPGTSEINTITFQSASGDSTDVSLNNTGGGYTLTLDGASYITFKNMTISTDAAGSGIYMKSEARNNQFLNNLIIGESGSYYLILDYHSNIFSKNRLVNGKYGILISSSDSGAEVRDNIFENQSTSALRISYVDGIIISDNSITSVSNIYGIYISNMNGKTTIERNKISLTGGGAGIFYWGWSATTNIPDHISNNFIHINATGDDQYGIYYYFSREIEILHNNIHITGNATSSSAIHLPAADSIIDIRNNILVNRASGRAIYTDASFNNKTSDYNCLYSNGIYLVNSSQTLKSHQNSTGQDAHSYSVDLKFISDNDLHTFNPYVNNQGTPIAEIDKDIDGETRDGTNPDIGADEYDLLPALNGTYNVGPSAPQLKTFTEAIDTLLAVGIDGPVVFEVENGTYNEQLIIPEIFGASSTNTITFQSASGDSTNVILTYASTDANNNYTLKLDGADYIIFKEITIEATGETYARILELDFNACKNVFTNNQFIGVTNTSELVYSNRLSTETESPDTSNVFINNRFVNGATGISFKSNIKATGTTIENNDFINQTNTAIYFNYYSNIKILSNYIHSDSTYTGIYLTELSDGDTISNNIIQIPIGGTGINLYNCDNTSVDTSLISNNFIYLNTINADHGINIYHTSTALKFLHNTIHIVGNNADSHCLFTNGSGINNYRLLYNNIFANEATGRSMYCTYFPNESDYNNLNSNGQYLVNNYTLANYQSYTGLDMHSLTVNPYFDADTSWHVQNVRLNGVGTPLAAVSTDIDGEVRNTTNPDIGADEFDPLPALSGSYNIGPSAPLFKTFAEAIDSMIIVGIGESVVFNVEDGTYNVQIDIPEIFGISATNTITFQSASGDSTKVIITHAASGDSDNYTLKLDGADYITFKDITLEATGADYARVVEIGYEAHGNTFSNNRILGVLNKSELVYSYMSRDTSTIFDNNIFSNGISAINMRSGSYTHGPDISGNEFVDQTGEAIYLSTYKNPIILSNYIHSDYQSTSIFLSYSKDKVEIGNNKILLPNGGKGIKLEFGQWVNTNDTSLIYNNFIYLNATNTSNPEYGILLNNNHLVVKIMFNTIHITGDNSSSACLYHVYSTYNDFRNNNLVNKAYGYTIYYESYSGLNSDFNNLFSNGVYLARSCADLEYWQTFSTKDLNSISVDPYFVVETSQHILNPALKGAGIPFIEVTEDLDGDTRDTEHPDIGADEFTLCNSPISGTFTIGGTTPDYETMNDAVEKLITCGINGPVTFNIATGTLVEQVSIQEISGASSTNTITFQSATGDSTDVLITFTPIITNLNHTIRLDGADYITFKNLSISSEVDWGNAVRLKNEATNNQFLNNRFFYEGTMTGNINFIYSSGSLDSNNIFDSNLFENGSVGIYMNGSTASDSISGIQIKNNIFKDVVSRGVYLNKHKGLDINGNQFEILSNTTSIGIYIDHSSSLIYNNFIQMETTGSGNGIQIGYSTGMIYNNFIQLEITGSGNGICLYSSSIPVLHNTIKITENSSSNTCSFYDVSTTVREIKNNIFANLTGGRAMHCDTTNLSSDYNLLYTNGSWLVQSSAYYANLSAWQAATGRDIHSISREPQFLSDTDLHTSDPWLNNIGTPLAEVTTDIDGEARDPVSPDIGADEFDGIMPFEGEYIIGPTGDFKSFTEAVDTISPVGIKSSVTFKVQSGTYNEQFVIPAIPDVSETNTITFTSASGDSTDVILQFDATANDNYTIKMDSCSYITFQNMTIKALDTIYARVVEFAGGASENILSNNVLMGLGTTSAVVYSTGDQDNNNRFNNNLITGGKIGIQMFGESASLLESGTEITANIFENQFSGAVVMKFNKASLITNNLITHPDLVDGQWTGIYIDECTGNGSNYGLIANNVIAFNTETMSAGIVLVGSSYQKIYYNSVNIIGSTDNSRAFNQQDGGSNNYLYNNIFSNKSGGLVIFTKDVNSFNSDFNNYYATGDKFIYYGVSDTEYYWISDLATWQTDYSKDLNSWSVDPKFVSDTNLLPGNIILDGSGAALAEVTEDLNGIPRDPVNPDIGAYEFAGCTTSGTFTIGPSGADYSTFEEAIESLQTCWASGPIIFNVQPGTYNEQVIFSEIPGASETNTITFQSASGDSTDVILTYESTSADTNYTVKLDGADYIRFKSMTIQATGNDYANVINILNGASNNQFHNNRFIGVNTTDPSNTNGALVYSPYGVAPADTSNIFSKNLFQTGSHGIYLHSHYSYSESNNQITGNRFEDQVSSSIYLYYQDSALISMNEISNTLSEKEYYGIYFYGTNSQIIKNEINLNNDRYNCTGVYISVYNETKPSFFSNNFVHISTNGNGRITGLSLNYCNSYYNSINITGGNVSSYAIVLPNSRSCSLKNNIFLNNAGGYAISYSDGSAANVSSDYNDLYSSGDYLAKYNSTNLINLAEWTGATTFDANSVSVDPMFMSDSDLHTQNPVINGAGTPIAETTDDIDGDTRDAATPDIGADEFESLLYVLGDNINACAYDTVTLDAGNGYDSYSWSNGTATRFADIDTTGVGLDSVKLVSTVMLGGQEYKDSLWVSFHKPVALTFDIDTCEWNYVELKASGGVSYHWELYVTNPDTCCVSVYLNNTTQNYVVTVYDSYGCYDTDTVTVVPNVKLSQPVIQFSNDSLLSSVTGTGYDWFLNSTTTGNTTQAILPQESGDYQVIVYNGGCPSDSSDSYSYIVGINDLAGNPEITLYPNPTDGKLFMSFEKPFKDLRLSVINMEGQVVLTRLLKDVPKGFLTELDLGEMPSGIYFIRFTNKEISRTARIIVR